jgi:CRISPR-associated protein Cmr6
MPIAAVPAYIPEKLFAQASPGLRFGMYLKVWGVNRHSRALLWTTHDLDHERRGRDQREREVQYENKRSGLDAACALTVADRRTMQALARRQRILAEPLARSGAALILEAEAVAPFTTGLGNEHPLENGFAFLHPYGLPYLPGSGVKGVVRQAARELASGDWGEAGGWNGEENYPRKIGEKVLGLSLIDVLFGRETPSGESEHVRGALSFWDVFPQIDGDRLLVEVMTAHQGHYYQDEQTPHDSGSPNPINFLTIPPRSRFTFHVLCNTAHLQRLAPAVAEGDRWRGLVDAAFQHAFQWLGFGAKTAVGYGAFASAVKTVEAVDRRAEPVAPETATPEANEAPTLTWDRARLQFNAQNGRLTAFGPGASAYADEPRGAALFARLPTEVQRRVRANPHSVRVTARVRGSELIDVEYEREPG